MVGQYEKRIVRVIEYIKDNPSTDLSLDVLADIAAMSRFHWHRVFHAMTGETCAQAVRRIRMQKAAMWLVSNQNPISEIALHVGYDNVRSFKRAFREHFKMPPRIFRKKGLIASPQIILSKGDSQMFEVEIKEMQAQGLGALLHEGAYIKVGPVYQKLFSILQKGQLLNDVRGIVGVYYNNPDMVDEKDLKTHVGAIFPENVELPKELEKVSLIGGTHAVLTYKGPYTGIKAAYDYLFGRWLVDSGKEPADAPCYELYLNNPVDTAPEDLLTQICLSLKI